MFYRTLLFATSILVLGMVSSVYAQKATEMYVPIGQSPGLSGKHTAIGTVDSLDALRGIMVVADSNRTYLVRFTDETEVFLDRSPLREPNTYGSIRDCRKYSIVEVKFRENKVGDTAEWIKVRVEKK